MQVSKMPSAPPQQVIMHESSHMSWKSRFALIVLAVLIGFFGLGATMLAKTGLVRVPLISGIVKSVGEPTRAVLVTPGTQASQEALRMQFEGAVARYARSGMEEDRVFRVRLSEAAITKSLLAELPSIKEQFQGATPESAQVSIDEDGIELYVRLERSGVKNSARFRFVPSITNGALRVDIKEATLGTQRMPVLLLNSVTGLVGKNITQEFLSGISSVAELKEIELRTGVMVIWGRLMSGVVNTR